MPNPIYLSLVLHNHQPVGNFDFVNEHSYRAAYLPLVALLEKYPDVQVALHFSGSLLEWLAEHHPDVLHRVRALVERGQVEILTGGYYEPILCSLPDEDKIGQIGKLTTAIYNWFGTEPAGLWLAERVWDPYLAKPLAEAGVKYVILDDTHFEMVGFDKNKDLFGYYVTEEQGHKLAVFPTLTRLRYSIPWRTVEENIAWLRDQADGPSYPRLQPRLVLMGEDGEKFGVWPSTHEHCWQNGYMEALFAALDANHDWLRTTTPGAFMAQHSALGRAYLPTASYMEMGEWSLPPALEYEFRNAVQDLRNEGDENMLRFVRGGSWRNFMVKYEEINRMHKRALQISRKVHAMPDGEDKKLALDLLWSAQSNDAYWHGVFGGIYLFHFRVANYANLIAAEMLAEGENPPLAVQKLDVNLDNEQELVVSSSSFLLIFDLAQGGALKEWDHRPAKYNLLNLMTRRDEGYHQDLLAAAAEGRVVVVSDDADYDQISEDMVKVKEAGIEKYLIADWYTRGSFIDHFLRDDATLEGFYRSAYPEQGDFVILPYEAEWTVEGDAAQIRLSRNGRVWVGERHLPVQVTKVFRVLQGSNLVEAAYVVRNQSEFPIDVRFGVESTLAFDGGADTRHCVFELKGLQGCLADIEEHAGVTGYSAVSMLRGLRTDVSFSRETNLWRFPLETVTLSEAGYERGYQGTAFLQWWPLHLEPGEAWEVTINMEAVMIG